jgi:beta-lactamase superfamily II metal-dependent hydrolase
MRRTFAILFALAIVCAVPLAQTRAKTLDIYIVDTEGGKATLFVSPSGESLLIDTGNPGGRDTERIMAAIQEAGLKQLDYVLLTHYHVDHVGGLQELATRIPIKHFIDHGPSVEEHEQVAGFQQAYAELYGKASHTVVKSGDKVPIAGLDWRIVTSAGKAIKTPLPGGGKRNPYCADFKPRENLRDPENGQSVGSVVTFGKFRAIDLGDLLWNNEGDLMCPNNPIGTVDLYLVSHHGTDPSGSTALVHALAPRVAIMQNGTRKGGTVQTFQTLHTSPGLEDIWDLHWAYQGGIEHNPPGVFIANIDDPQTIANVLTSPPPAPGARGGMPGGAPPPGAGAPPSGAPQAGGAPGSPAGPPSGGRQGGPGGGRGGHTGPAFMIKVSAQEDGTFTVTNTRNQFSKTYHAIKR